MRKYKCNLYCESYLYCHVLLCTGSKKLRIGGLVLACAVMNPYAVFYGFPGKPIKHRDAKYSRYRIYSRYRRYWRYTRYTRYRNLEILEVSIYTMSSVCASVTGLNVKDQNLKAKEKPSMQYARNFSSRRSWRYLYGE